MRNLKLDQIQTLLTIADRGTLGEQVRRRAQGLEGVVRLALNHPDAIRALVAAGRGAALLPLEHGDDTTPQGMQLRPLQPALLRPLGLASRASDADDAVVQGMLQTLQAVGGS